jgi:hypothetical protein
MAMIEDIFLTYANEPSRNNPKFFQSVFSAVRNNISIDLTGVDDVLKCISELSVCDDVSGFLSCVAHWGSINQHSDSFRDPLYHATMATAGRRFDHYNDLDQLERGIKKKKDRWLVDYEKKLRFNCGYREVAEASGRVERCENAFTMKCYECFQFGFVDMLIPITEGKEFDDIEDFIGSVSFASELDVVRTDKVIIQKQEGPFRNALIGKTSYAVGYLEFERGSLGNDSQAFNSFVFTLSTLSLSRFLLKNDRRKLKFCSYCNKFFIAKDIKRKHCCYSSECQKQLERDNKRKQRGTDPVKYA